jgi:DNA-binding phage protein
MTDDVQQTTAPDLLAMLGTSADAWRALSADERAALVRRQQVSWIAGQTGLSRETVERELVK